MPTTESGMPEGALQEMESVLGNDVRLFRINTLKIDQETLAGRAGINVRTLRNLESGHGTSLRTFLAVIRAMDRQTWLRMLVPKTAVRPKVLVLAVKQPKRVNKPKNQQ
ncbi:helix-turn-helix domain-containing protein [Herbaspirillum robiniae]|uniref:helix-turn-helix domain-containing protein n=1 Tax=Herbaspirillum robiniae TaxID=2014887 RepID=UPI0011E4CA14|nr:XRE family transcriptional regulator [Herbaspirillum robiniae]